MGGAWILWAVLGSCGQLLDLVGSPWILWVALSPLPNTPTVCSLGTWWSLKFKEPVRNLIRGVWLWKIKVPAGGDETRKHPPPSLAQARAESIHSTRQIVCLLREFFPSVPHTLTQNKGCREIEHKGYMLTSPGWALCFLHTREIPPVTRLVVCF